MNSSSPGPSPKKRRIRRLLFFGVYAVVISALLVEGTMRLMMTEEGGQDSVFGLKLLPFPIVREESQQALQTPPEQWTYYVPDPDLGWTIKPQGKSGDGLFCASNALGLRDSGKGTELQEGVHRVLLIGDSYTHGDQVPWEETWAAQLADQLGEGHQVLNGGVGGYGTDQAVLRWRKLRDAIQPRTVVLAIYPEDLWRNLTFFRSIKHHWTSFPFSKPRFILDGEELKLVNAPVIPPADVPKTLRAYEHHEFRAHDPLFFPEFYEDSPGGFSATLRWIRSKRFYARRHDRLQELIEEGGEGTEIAARLVGLFMQEAATVGSKPIVLLLPGAQDLPAYSASDPSATSQRLRALRHRLEQMGLPFFDLGSALRRNDVDGKPDLEKLYVDGTGHMALPANIIVATEVARLIRP